MSADEAHPRVPPGGIVLQQGLGGDILRPERFGAARAAPEVGAPDDVVGYEEPPVSVLQRVLVSECLEWLFFYEFGRQTGRERRKWQRKTQDVLDGTEVNDGEDDDDDEMDDIMNLGPPFSPPVLLRKKKCRVGNKIRSMFKKVGKKW